MFASEKIWAAMLSRDGDRRSSVPSAATVDSRGYLMSGTATGFTWKDADGVKREVFTNGAGACFVFRESGGRAYRKYLPRPVSRRIYSELDLDYTNPAHLIKNNKV